MCALRYKNVINIWVERRQSRNVGKFIDSRTKKGEIRGMTPGCHSKTMMNMEACEAQTWTPRMCPLGQ